MLYYLDMYMVIVEWLFVINVDSYWLTYVVYLNMMDYLKSVCCRDEEGDQVTAIVKALI